MWYDKRVFKRKSSFVNNVNSELSTGINVFSRSEQAITKTTFLYILTGTSFRFHRKVNSAFLNSNQRLSYLYPTNLDKMSFLSSDLANLSLSLKTYTFLKQKGIHKIGDLVGYSPKSLLQFLNKNKEMFVEVKTYLLTKS